MLVIDYVADGMYELVDVDKMTHEPIETIEESDDLAHLISIGRGMGEQVYLPETLDMMVHGTPEPPASELESTVIVESVINEIMKSIVEKVMKDLDALDDTRYNDEEEDESFG